MTNVSMSMPTRRVEMWFSGPAPQRRVTVVFRIILALPQIIALIFLEVVGIVVVVIGWFGALFTGRLPEFAHTFLSGLIRWEVRVGAYLFLLTDHYPPFTLVDVEYPVRPILPGRGPLNRVAVFFRIILAIPASVFTQIVFYGLAFPLLFVMWIVVIVTGSMPPTLYTTYTALLRYQTRFRSYFDLITSEYAWGMFGDFVPAPPASSPPPLGAVAGEMSVEPPPVPPVPPVQQAPPAPPQSQPPAQPFSYPSTGEQAATPPAYPGGAPGSPGWSPPRQPPPMPPPPMPPTGVPGAPGAMPPPTSWERTSLPSSVEPLPPWGILILQGAAKGWMIFAIVWGAIVFIGVDSIRGHGHHHNTASGQVTTVPAHTSAPGSSNIPPA
jgi:hypothetical protein